MAVLDVLEVDVDLHSDFVTDAQDVTDVLDVADGDALDLLHQGGAQVALEEGQLLLDDLLQDCFLQVRL